MFPAWSVPFFVLASSVQAAVCSHSFFFFFDVSVHTSATDWAIFIKLPLAKSQIHPLPSVLLVAFGIISSCLCGNLGCLIWKFIGSNLYKCLLYISSALRFSKAGFLLENDLEGLEKKTKTNKTQQTNRPQQRCVLFWSPCERFLKVFEDVKKTYNEVT